MAWWGKDRIDDPDWESPFVDIDAAPPNLRGNLKRRPMAEEDSRGGFNPRQMAQVNQAMARFDDMSGGGKVISTVRHELELMYDVGFNDGLIAADSKLAQALDGLQRGSNALETLKRERDAILEEYARVSWENAIRGMLAAGMHPPAAHRNPKLVAKLGTAPCGRCKADLTLWDRLPGPTKKDKMARVWAAVMKERARRIVDSAPIAQAPTTTELGGQAQPSLGIGPCRPEDKHRNCECKCTHAVAHCCTYHCCCFDDKYRKA